MVEGEGKKKAMPGNDKEEGIVDYPELTTNAGIRFCVAVAV